MIDEAIQQPRLQLSDRHAIFVGFKLDGTLRRELQALTGPDRKYVSESESTFLRLCEKAGDLYVGKVIEDGLTTDRVDDVCRNVLSILRRVAPETRLPTRLGIWVCLPDPGRE